MAADHGTGQLRAGAVVDDLNVLLAERAEVEARKTATAAAAAKKRENDEKRRADAKAKADAKKAAEGN
jgi:hypothetical protein